MFSQEQALISIIGFPDFPTPFMLCYLTARGIFS